MKNSQYVRQAQYKKGFIAPLLLAIIAVLVIGGGVYVYKNNIAEAPATMTFTDSDLKIYYVTISGSNNSALAFNTVKTDTMSKVDLDFLSKYLANYSSKDLPPVAQSQKILSTYSNLLSIFDVNANKKYQCSTSMGDTCSFQPIRNIANLAALRALTSFQQNKKSQAQTTVYDLIALGKNVTANTDDVIPLLIGWSVQKLGYNVLSAIYLKGSAILFTDSEKANLIAQLRQEQKKVFKHMYTRTAEGIDYITSPEKKPSSILTADYEDTIAIYRKGAAASQNAWNPIETKKYFYDSYKIALSNVDLACGATPKTSVLNLNFNPQDQQTENYVGKTMYSTTYSSLDTLSTKRCDVENLIKNL